MVLHPVFGQFADNCRDHVATPEDHKLTYILSGRMLVFFNNEASRRDAFVSIMRENLGLQLLATGPTGSTTDGHTVAENGHVRIISEDKNELGSGAGDPTYQSVSHYLKFVRTWHKVESVLLCLYYAGELGN